MNYKLIAMDLDGTLVNRDKVITPRTLEALMNAQHRGIRLALASARPSPGLNKERDALRMREHGGILMSYNGGRIIDAETGSVLFESTMTIEQAKWALKKLESLPVVPILDDGKRFYVTDHTAFMVEYECWNNGMEWTEVDNLVDFLTFAPVKILLAIQPELLPDVQKTSAAFLPEDLSVVQTAAFYLEIIPRRINKGQGVIDVCRALNILPEEVIAFGDAANDIPMLRAAGMGVAMGNASEDVKAAADRTTLSCDEDGIAAALDELLGSV